MQNNMYDKIENMLFLREDSAQDVILVFTI